MGKMKSSLAYTFLIVGALAVPHTLNFSASQDIDAGVSDPNSIYNLDMRCFVQGNSGWVDSEYRCPDSFSVNTIHLGF